MMVLCGIVDVRTVGKAKVFFLSKRLPVTSLLIIFRSPLFKPMSGIAFKVQIFRQQNFL
jgi:hypothetical protein